MLSVKMYIRSYRAGRGEGWLGWGPRSLVNQTQKGVEGSNTHEKPTLRRSKIPAEEKLRKTWWKFSGYIRK
jgi:hypothetical protein